MDINMLRYQEMPLTRAGAKVVKEKVPKPPKPPKPTKPPREKKPPKEKKPRFDLMKVRIEQLLPEVNSNITIREASKILNLSYDTTRVYLNLAAKRGLAVNSGVKRDNSSIWHRSDSTQIPEFKPFKGAPRGHRISKARVARLFADGPKSPQDLSVIEGITVNSVRTLIINWKKLNLIELDRIEPYGKKFWKIKD